MIKMNHTGIGDGHLTTTADGVVFAADDGMTYGPGDKFPSARCNAGYLHQISGIEYTAKEVEWVDDYIVATVFADATNFGPATVWKFGASWKNADQLRRIESADGRVFLNS